MDPQPSSPNIVSPATMFEAYREPLFIRLSRVLCKSDNRELSVLTSVPLKNTSLYTRVSDVTVIRVNKEREQQPRDYYFLLGKKRNQVRKAVIESFDRNVVG
jgi:hypothetical protein